MSEVFVYTTDPAGYRSNAYLTPAPEKCSGYGLCALIASIANPVGVEIGVAEGFTSEFLMRNHQNLELTCIDPFMNYIDWNGNNLNERESIGQQFLLRMQPFSDRLNVIRKTSDDAVNDIRDNSLDFIFIDGLHTYDQLSKDCRNYYSKVKEGGIFAGHDYRVIAEVKKAVDEFALLKNKTILETECDVWYWYK